MQTSGGSVTWEESRGRNVSCVRNWSFCGKAGAAPGRRTPVLSLSLPIPGWLRTMAREGRSTFQRLRAFTCTVYQKVQRSGEIRAQEAAAEVGGKAIPPEWKLCMASREPINISMRAYVWLCTC